MPGRGRGDFWETGDVSLDVGAGISNKGMLAIKTSQAVHFSPMYIPPCCLS